MKIVAAEDDRNSAWASDSTAFGRKMLAKMGWTEGGSIENHRPEMNTNLR